MGNLRGKVSKIHFYIEYPDGSKKETVFEPKAGLKAILCSDEFMTEEMKNMFTKSDSDWKKNPAMVIVDGDVLGTTCEFPQCQNA